MQEVIFDLQTITPLFLAGADQGTAELRAPSFRGAMRYWQRALVGGLVGADPIGLKEVIKAEAGLFGATDTGSRVCVKITGLPGEPIEYKAPRGIALGGGRYKATGKGYLLWSMGAMGRPARWYFPADTQFQVTLSTRDQDKSMLKEATAAFWLLTQLGGIGSRSRRCAGSLVTTSVTGNTSNLLSAPSVNLFSSPSTIQGLRDQLQNGIRESRDLYKKLPQRSTPNVQFDILAKGACRIWIFQGPGPQPWRSAEDTLSAIGESLQSYRSSISPPERRTIFGLPLLIRGLQNWKLRKQLEESRRASPLHLHVTKLQTTQGTRFVGVVVLFKTQGAGIRTSDYKLIEDWIARDFPTPSALEVML